MKGIVFSGNLLLSVVETRSKGDTLCMEILKGCNFKNKAKSFSSQIFNPTDLTAFLTAIFISNHFLR